MALYRLLETDHILRISDGAFIPFDPANSDYAVYLQWVAAGNVADPVVVPPINQEQQLAARTEFRAKKLEDSGELLAAYALRQDLANPDVSKEGGVGKKPAIPSGKKKNAAFQSI